MKRIVQPSRRQVLLFGASLGAASLSGACAARSAPLAHLSGPAWVQGAYALYAGEYAEVQSRCEVKSRGAYALLAQRGATALDGLQRREVPFYLRVDAQTSRFRVEREVPERLTFTAGMSAEERARAESSWKLARDHIHTDYEEVRRLDWALSVLFDQLVAVRRAIEAGKREQYRLVLQLAELDEDPSALPYELPAGVSAKDYGEIVLLLVERLEDDGERLGVLEGHILSVGLTARSTDAGSATLAASLRKILLAVETDGLAPSRPAELPGAADRDRLLARARELRRTIAASEGFATWKREEEAKSFEAFGSFLGVLDQVTGIPISPVFGTAVKLWRGDDDYLGYVRTVAGFLPRGTVKEAFEGAIDVTETARRAAPAVRAVAGGDASEAFAQGEGWVLGTGSQFARERMGKQLAFFREAGEIEQTTRSLAETRLATMSLADVPGAPR